MQKSKQQNSMRGFHKGDEEVFSTWKLEQTPMTQRGGMETDTLMEDPELHPAAMVVRPQLTHLPSSLDLDLEEPVTQQFKRLKICDEEEDGDRCETEEFSHVDIKSALETQSDPILNSARPMPSAYIGANTFTSLDTLHIQLPHQSDEKVINMGMRLRKLNKKEIVKKEADLTILKRKTRKSLFFAEQIQEKRRGISYIR